MQNNRTGDTLCSQFPTFPGSLMGHRHSDLRKLANIYTFFAHSSTPRVLRKICKFLFLKENKHSVLVNDDTPHCRPPGAIAQYGRAGTALIEEQRAGTPF